MVFFSQTLNAPNNTFSVAHILDMMRSCWRRPDHYCIYVEAFAEKRTVLLSTSLAWPAVAGCSRAETFSQLSSISFAQPCNVADNTADYIFFLPGKKAKGGRIDL